MFSGNSRARQGSPVGSPWFAALILALATACAAQAPASADDPGWVLTQKSRTLGDQYVYISPNGLKLVNPAVGFAIVSHAPDWNITLFNEKTRVYYETTASKWKHDLEARGLKGSDLLNGSWKRATKGNIAGTKCTQYVMGPNTSTFTNLHGKKVTMSVKGAWYWIADDIKVPPNLVDLMSTAYGLPTSPSVPLRLSVDGTHGEEKFLDTYRTQTSPIPVSYFTCPAGFKQVSSDAEVMMTADQKQMIDDMSKELGSSPDAAPHSAASTGAAAAAPAATTGGAASASLPGGLKVTKEDLGRLLDALKKTR